MYSSERMFGLGPWTISFIRDPGCAGIMLYGPGLDCPQAWLYWSKGPSR